eukprot:jgi/Orpsp1_1/1192257/evm.model.d7180000091787.1
MITIAIFLISISLTIIIILHKFQDNYIIKGGGKVFLIFILIGTILNYTTVILETKERDFAICVLINITRNIGFSLIYSSILFKTLRIYNAIRKVIGTKVLSKKSMYISIIVTTIFHIIMDVVWDMFIGYKVITKYTSDEKEYLSCEKLKFKEIILILDLIILATIYYLMYCIRNIQQEYKETITVPLYICVIGELITELMETMNDISPLFK